MKKTILLLLLSISSFAQIGINTSNPQAILDIQSTTSGILIPRLSQEQVDAVQNPENSMLIFNLETNKYQYNNFDEWVTIPKVVNYSFQETATNQKWVDGRTIYQITAEGSCSCWMNEQPILTLPELDKIIREEGEILTQGMYASVGNVGSEGLAFKRASQSEIYLFNIIANDVSYYHYTLFYVKLPN